MTLHRIRVQNLDNPEEEVLMEIEATHRQDAEFSALFTAFRELRWQRSKVMPERGGREMEATS